MMVKACHTAAANSTMFGPCRSEKRKKKQMRTNQVSITDEELSKTQMIKMAREPWDLAS